MTTYQTSYKEVPVTHTELREEVNTRLVTPEIRGNGCRDVVTGATVPCETVATEVIGGNRVVGGSPTRLVGGPGTYPVRL